MRCLITRYRCIFLSRSQNKVALISNRCVSHMKLRFPSRYARTISLTFYYENNTFARSLSGWKYVQSAFNAFKVVYPSCQTYSCGVSPYTHKYREVGRNQQVAFRLRSPSLRYNFKLRGHLSSQFINLRHNNRRFLDAITVNFRPSLRNRVRSSNNSRDLCCHLVYWIQ